MNKETFEKFVSPLSGAGQDGDKPFSTLAEVLEYLESNWKITKTSLYRHQSKGKLVPCQDGSYALKAVEQYARAWLKQKSTGKRIQEKQDELQRKKLEIELKNEELDHQRKQLALNKDLGKYVPRELMEIELATRAGVLDAGLKHWVQSRAAEWIRAVDGDTKKVGDLINLMGRDLDEHINSYAASPDFQVVIDAEEDMMEEAYEQPG